MSSLVVGQSLDSDRPAKKSVLVGFRAQTPLRELATPVSGVMTVS